MNPFYPISLQASLILQVPQVIYKRGINTTVGNKVKQSLLSPSVSNSEKTTYFSVKECSQLAQLYSHLRIQDI